MSTTIRPDMTAAPSWASPEDVPDWMGDDFDGDHSYRLIEHKAARFDFIDESDDDPRLVAEDYAVLVRAQVRDNTSGQIVSVDWIEVDSVRLTAEQAHRLADVLHDLAGVMALEGER